MRRLLKILLALGTPTLALAVGTVTTSLTQLGTSQNWVLQYSWTADASAATVPATAAPQLVQNAILQGYRVFQVEIVAGSPAPTNNYTVTLTDGQGADILGAQASANQSSTGKTFYGVNAPAINGTLTLNVSGNAVNSAQGTVYVYLGPQATARLFPTSLPPSGAAGGDLSGTYPNPTVAKVNGSTPGGTCINQVVTVISTSAIPTCTTVTSAYVDSSIAPTASPSFTNATTDRLTITGPLSIAAWGTAGVPLKIVGSTYTDTSSSGTVATAMVSAIGIPTLAASNATTYTDSATFYIAGKPAAGGNVTITNAWAAYFAADNIYMAGALKIGSGSFPDKLTVNGDQGLYGTSGTRKFTIQNTGSGTTDNARLLLQNNNGANNQALWANYSSGYTGTAFGITVANWVLLDQSGGSNQGLIIGNESNKPIVFGTNNAEQMRLMASGNFVLGSTTDGNIRLDLAKSGSSGTFRCYDQTASTGVTQCTFRAGAGQSTTSILSVQNNSAANLLSIVSSGTSYFKPSSDSTTPFQVQNAAGSAFANFDSTNQVSTFGNNGTAGVGLSIQRQSSRYDQSTYNTYGSTYIAGATGYTAVNQFDENTGLFAYYVSTASVAAGATSTFNVGYTVSAAGNASFLGNVAPLNGATTIYRCSVAGTLRVGQLTSVSADCGTAVDTGLRTP